MPHTFSVITDEVSPDLAAGLRFAAEEGLSTVDIRSVGGVNFLSFEASEQKRIAAQIRDAGLTVGCLATPLLKWAPPGKGAATSGDQFGFETRERSTEQLYDDAFAAAAILGTRHLRIFSYLSYDGFVLADLEPAYDALLRRAETHDAVLHVENEPVCNVLSVADLAAATGRWNHPRLRGLLDIGNAYYASAPPSAADLAAVMPHVDLIHFKDYATAKRGYVPMGEGDIPYAQLMAPCFAAARTRPLILVIETHVPNEQPDATRRSLAGLRALAAGQG